MRGSKAACAFFRRISAAPRSGMTSSGGEALEGLRGAGEDEVKCAYAVLVEAKTPSLFRMALPPPRAAQIAGVIETPGFRL